MYKQEENKDENKKSKEEKNNERSSYNSSVYESEDDLLEYVPFFSSVMMLSVDLRRYQKIQHAQRPPPTIIKKEH